MDRREREKTLNDRLQQMAMPNDVPYSNHDRPPRDIPLEPEMHDHRMYKGGPPSIQGPEIDLEMDMYNMRGPPPDEYDHGMNGPPPPMMDDYVPPMMDHPDEWMDGGGPPMHPPRMHRDDYEQHEQRFGRGRRDYRDKFEPRGRGPPPGPPDYYPPPRDGFGPRGMMRGPDFAPPRPGMRGAGHKFHPRGPPPMRGPRPSK